MRVGSQWRKSVGLAAVVIQPPTIGDVDRLALAIGIEKGLRRAVRRLGWSDSKGTRLAAVLADRGFIERVAHGKICLTLAGKAHCLEVLAPWRSAFSQDKQGEDSLF